MATNIPSGGWRVKIVSIPESITISELAQTVGLSNYRIYIPKVKKNDSSYAWIDGFVSKDEATKFVRQWSETSVFGGTVTFIVTAPRSNQTKDALHSSRESLLSDMKTLRQDKVLPNKQHEPQSVIGAKGRRDNFNSPTTPVSLMSMITSGTCNTVIDDTEHKSMKQPPPSFDRNINREKEQRPTSGPVLRRVAVPVPSTAMGTTKEQDFEDKRPLCRFANKGNCQMTTGKCKYRHVRCPNFDSCSQLDCRLAHTQREPVPAPLIAPPAASLLPSGVQEYERNSSACYSPMHRSDSGSSMSSIQSMNINTKQCCHGVKCFNVNCNFNHPDGWHPCNDGAKCEKYECTGSHPFTRKATCRDGDHCKSSKCKFLHPNTRAEECPLRAKCQKWNCPKIHPRSRAQPCTNKENCTNVTCLCLHPPERIKLLCPIGVDCRDLSCRLNHPSERPAICDQLDTCSNFNCIRLHGPDWNPCEAGDECEDDHCSRTHPPKNIINPQENTAATTTNNNKNKNQNAKKKYSKSLEQRMKDREKAQLPILACQSEFCQRLKREGVLVVTAETGSGKSTQLPQYAAEHFGSLVVCTQPRVVAALSLARRVAEEYDGRSVGESVGYKVGNANRVQGTSIMFMTDAALIRESQRDPSLKHIRVLIVDEAHERSLNTDIVIGISKLLLAQRPDDFYVVIASATIDPTRFLHFFDRPTNTPLDVKGRVFPVTVASKPPSSGCSDQKLIESHIVPSVVELYPHHEGHTLVFLHGQGEIERALRVFKSKLPDDCIPLPLYGSQSPEDQERVIRFDEKGKRMVVFCTNVAETSLTIPNVRLVIDSGWAKEARFDVKRRLTIIETVRISRSSADQRKGRAGRTAPGHCVRLYDETELKRANIEPEILRSSLDLVLLQLIRLNLDPNTFPFMDQPKNDVISNSIDLLVRLKCMDDQKITKRGELYTELGLDPRLSAFIIEIYAEYESLLESAVAIVAILSAPGTVFFMGGATQEAKQEAKARVALQAHNHKSDLIHLYSVYTAWKNAGSKEKQGNCSLCKKQVKWCICRVKYSNENGLNNKILQNIDASCTSIIKQIKNARWLNPGSEMPQNSVDIIGARLAQLFPEQCGYLLIPQLPAEGARLVSTDIRAMITDSSVFMQKLHVDRNHELYQHFVAMTVTQLPSGNYIIERLHPIPRTLATVKSSMQNLMTIENISSEVFHQMRQKLNTYRTEPWAKWLVYQHDRPHCRFNLWGLDADQSTIIPIVQRLRNETMRKIYDAYELLECGPIKANFRSGLLCTHINKMTNALQLDLQNVPNQTSNELKDWLKKNIGVEWDEIKTHGFHTPKDQSKRLYLIFKNEDAFRRATNKVPPCHISEQENRLGIRQDSEKESWGRELTVQTPPNVSAQDIIDRYGANVVMKCLQLNKQNEKPRVESSLKLNNLPPTTDENSLRQCLQHAGGPNPKHVHVGHAGNNASAWAKVIFIDEEQRNKAAATYDLQLCQSSFPITIIGKRGPMQKFVQTKVEKDDDTHTQPRFLPKNLFRVTFTSREATLHIFTSETITTTNLTAAAESIPEPTDTSTWIVDSSATVTALRTDLYPDFQQTVNRICEKFGVQVKSKDILNHGKRFTFNHGSPQKTSLAASMLAQNCAPVNIKLNTDRQKQLFNELEEVGQIQKWAYELELAINKNKWNTNIEIRGPQIAQGQFMRRIADYSDGFNKRFREHELSATIATFFGRQKAASVKLQNIASQWSSKSCLVSFIPKTSTIIIIGKPEVSLKDMNDCEKEVIQLLDQTIATTYDEDSEEEEDEDENDAEENDMRSVGAMRQDRRCVFCQQKSSVSTSSFRICGHTYCRCAAQALSTSITFPLQCKDCASDIHIRDIQIIFSNDEDLFRHLRKSSIQNYLTQDAQDDRIFCPNDECEGLIKNRGYQTCLTCGQSVCPTCQVIDDELHVGRTCTQLAEEKKRREFLPQLFETAKKFVQDNWPLDAQMQPIGRIDENSYLAKQYKSLTRFYKGIKTLGHSFPPDLAKGFFAYHGTASQAIGPICQNGFDPKRRSGQVYGRGEYFGVTAAVSHGYAQKGGSQSGFSQMIISYLLRCAQVTTKENFCYVADNPVDWNYALNLPVLVITYGENAPRQPSSFPDIIHDYVDDESSWNAPFRWYWRQGNGQFEPYNDIINQILEKFYEQWKLNGGPSTVVTPPLTRYLDDIPQTYKIDYQNNRQTNMKTSFPRIIDRRPTEKPPDNQNWFYQNEHGAWTRYETLVQDSIEKAFQLYRSGRGSSTTDIHFPGRPETYQINFSIGQQTNTTTNALKHVKRE